MSQSVIDEPISVSRAQVRSQRHNAWFELILRSPASMAGLLIAIAAIGIGLFANILAPHDYAAVDVTQRFLPPSLGHPFGTDEFGRDLLSRVIFGARTSLIVALSSTLVGATLGVVLGVTAGYFGRASDEAIMRLMDIMLAFPSIVLGIALATVLGPSISNLALIIGFIQIPAFARVARSSTLVVKAQEYVVAARTLGQSNAGIMIRHVVPNILGPLVVLASLTVPGAIVTEAALSFLGLGVQPPTPSWGNLVFDGTRFIYSYPLLVALPGIVLSIAVLGFNLLGDGLRDVLDPRSRR